MSALDECKTCHRRITDFDEEGMEDLNGQRWCRDHWLTREHPSVVPVAEHLVRIAGYTNANGHLRLTSGDQSVLFAAGKELVALATERDLLIEMLRAERAMVSTLRLRALTPDERAARRDRLAEFTRHDPADDEGDDDGRE
jgi:hypothetical protein